MKDDLSFGYLRSIDRINHYIIPHQLLKSVSRDHQCYFDCVGVYSPFVWDGQLKHPTIINDERLEPGTHRKMNEPPFQGALMERYGGKGVMID